MTNKETAEKLGIAEKYFYQLRKKPGFPASGSFEEVAAWFTKYKEGQKGGSELQDCKLEKLVEEVGLLRARRATEELELRRLEKSLVPLSEAKDAIAKVLRPLRLQLDALPSRLAHELNREDPVLAETVLREALETIFTEVSAGDNPGAVGGNAGVLGGQSGDTSPAHGE